MEIEVKTSPLEVRRILKNVPGIERIEAQTAGNGVTKGSIHEKKGEDIRENVFRAFASAGSPLLTLKVSGTTLEDVFMELTQKDTVPAAFAKKIGWEEIRPENPVPPEGAVTADVENADSISSESVTDSEDQEELIKGEGADQDAGDL